MSAICGIVYWDGKPVTPQILSPVMDATACYGGDGHGIWIEGAVGLGHHLRHDTPESVHETLPFTHRYLSITADARIDNRTDLCNQLAIPHGERADVPDSILILRAYETWGMVCAQHLIGDFAFAIWDGHAQHLYCARDHVGARPFYYYHATNLFAFASDLDALFTFVDVPVAIDEVQVANALLHRGPRYYHPARTFFQHIHRLAPARQVVVRRSGRQLSAHWQPPTDELRLPTAEDYAARTRELFEEAVVCRLRTDFGVGAHMSGGLDSSSVAIVAARHLKLQGRDLPVYSWSPPAGQNPDEQLEQYRIEAICRQEGLVCRYIPKAPRNIGDMAGGGPAMLGMEQLVMQQAADDGVRVMLSGWGGDEFISFNGRGIRADYFASGRWWALLKTFRWGLHLGYLKSFLAGMWRDVVLVFVPGTLYSRWSQEVSAKDPADTFLAPGFLAQAEPEAKQRYRYQERGRSRNQQQLFEDGHLAERMESWHKGGAAQGLTYVYPLLDRRIMEFAFRVPDCLFLRRGVGRYLFRRATESLFPTGMAWVAVKTQQGMNRHLRTIQRFAWHFAEDQPQEMDPEALLADAEVPWVDVARLREALRVPTISLQPADRLAVGRAMQAVRLWRMLQTRIDQKVCPDDGNAATHPLRGHGLHTMFRFAS